MPARRSVLNECVNSVRGLGGDLTVAGCWVEKIAGCGVGVCVRGVHCEGACFSDSWLPFTWRAVEGLFESLVPAFVSEVVARFGALSGLRSGFRK